MLIKYEPHKDKKTGIVTSHVLPNGRRIRPFFGQLKRAIEEDYKVSLKIMKPKAK